MSLHSFAHWVALESGGSQYLRHVEAECANRGLLFSGASNAIKKDSMVLRSTTQSRLFIVIDESSYHTVVDSTVAAH